MSHAKEITAALANVPNDVAIPVLSDIIQRITDWLASGGDANAPYIRQQVEYAKKIGQRFGKEDK